MRMHALPQYWAHLLKWDLWALAFGASLGAVGWFGMVLGVTPGGVAGVSAVFDFLWFLFGSIAFVALLFGWPALLIRKQRGRSFRILSCCLVFLAAAYPGRCAVDAAERRGFQACAARNMRLVETIKGYAAEHGTPPKDLGELATADSKELYRTGMPIYPQFTYVSGEEAQRRFNGNPWALFIELPCGMFCERMLVYLPNENYAGLSVFRLEQSVGRWGLIGFSG